MKKIISLIFILSTLLANAKEKELYQEEWRPQYHFTPAHRWIGDPCGLVHFNGVFHAYSWGAYESADLLHWNEINHDALKDVPTGIGEFTGSVVVDKNNTSGYGNDTFVAAFTSFDENSKKQSQSVAFSNDNGRNFHYYDRNPVIDIWSTEFRDPTVVWDNERNRWVMLVAKALEKKIAFYASSNLKDWVWLSDFGPLGDSDRSWECPDMFQLEVDNSGKKKWVVVVSVNWAKEQYFVGDFDGTRFIPEMTEQYPLYVDNGLDYYASRTFQDYDDTLGSIYSLGWVSTWDYAQHVPTKYGKGVWSLPRELCLTSTAQGYRLIQKPIAGLKALRGTPYSYKRTLKAGTTSLTNLAKMNNQYELVADFSTSQGNTFGLNLCSGTNQQVTLTYNVKSQTLLLDRTNASKTSIPKFERIAFAKVPLVNNHLQLDIFVDKSVIEIYANDGACVMTALVFPSDDDTNVELFSLDNGKTNVDLSAYPMSSVWDKQRESASESAQK